MKKWFWFGVVFFLIMNVIRAQDPINYTLMINNASCNLVPNGDAEVNVVPTNPPYSYLWDFGATTHIVHDLPAGNYTVTVTDGSGNDTTIRVEVRAYGGTCPIKSELAFTPNGDGFNDVWLLSNIEYFPNNSIVVFNIWGQKVFESSGVYIPWNGNDMAGIPVPDNSYFYIILSDKKNEDTIVKGSISVIR